MEALSALPRVHHFDDPVMVNRIEGARRASNASNLIDHFGFGLVSGLSGFLGSIALFAC